MNANDLTVMISRMSQDQLMEALRILAHAHPNETADAIRDAQHKYPIYGVL